MEQSSGYFSFIRENLPFLTAGFLLSFVSSFGQTYFIAIFGAEIRNDYGLTNGEWGLIYMIGTAVSALVMVFAGGLADRFRVRSIGIVVILMLALSCLAMALNSYFFLLPFIIFALRFTGQGMVMHISVVAMARWFTAARGRALAIASMGFMFGEATMPLTLVWLKSFVDWRVLWVGFAIFACFLTPILWSLLRLERTPSAASAETANYGMNGKHWSRADAIKNPILWLTAPAVMFFSAFGTAFWFHQAHFAEIKGWSHLSFVAVFPLGTIALGISTIVFGWLIDKFGAARLLPYYLLPYIGAFFISWFAPNLFWIAIAVVLMGISGGGNATLISACWAEFYGTKHLGSIKALAAAIMVFGSAIGPGMTGWLIDVGIGLDRQMLFISLCFAMASIALIFVSRSVLARSL